MERRIAARLGLGKTLVRETNGDYFFSFRARDLSEDGIFLENKFCVGSLEPFSALTFQLPNGVQLQNLTARVIREVKGHGQGCALEFMNLTETARLEIKRYLAQAS